MSTLLDSASIDEEGWWDIEVGEECIGHVGWGVGGTVEGGIGGLDGG